MVKIVTREVVKRASSNERGSKESEKNRLERKKKAGATSTLTVLPRFRVP